MNTTAFFNELAEILTQEIELHERLTAAAKDINASARAKDIEGIGRKSAAYDELICGLEKIEDRRVEVCETLHGLTGGTESSGRLISLVEHCEPKLKTKILSLKTELIKRVTELKAANTSNTVLFKEALGEIEATVGIIRESARPRSGYRHKGDFKPSRSCSISTFNQVG